MIDFINDGYGMDALSKTIQNKENSGTCIISKTCCEGIR